MANKIPIIDANNRERFGTRYTRRLRATGVIPAVIYGHKKDPAHVSFNEINMMNHLRNGDRVFDLNIEGKNETCLVRDLQYDHLSTTIIHMDLARIDMTETVTMQIPVNLTGTPVGLKVPGAILRTVSETVEVSCTPLDIPDGGIILDITDLEAGNHMTAGDLEMPNGLTLLTVNDALICRIPVVVEEVDETDEDAVVGEPEVIGEKDSDADAEGTENAGE